jgi:hypothetical protein
VASFDEVVPPGKAGSIKASIHTGNYKGAIGKSITVTHDDATQGPITVSVLAKIVGSVDVLPFPALQLGRHRRGFETPAKLILRKDASEQGTLAIDGLVASASWLKVGSRKVESEEPAVEGLPAAMPGDVVLSIQAEAAPVGTSVETISFKTGLTREPKVTIPVTVNVQPLITLQPNDLILNPTPGAAEGASGQVLASLRDDLDPKTVTVASEAPAFVVRLEPPGERAFRVIVDWAGKGKNPPTETTIHIRVGAETVNLPVRVDLSRTTKVP